MEVSVETLAHGTMVCISRAHRFGTDAMLLSGFARPRRAETAVDLCSGCGIVALRWHDLGHRGPCRAVEVDPEGTSLLEQALAEDAALAHITPVCADLNELRGDGLAHLVAANPPYFTVEQVAAAAAALLRDGGRFALCHRADQFARVCAVLSAAGLEPKRAAFAKQKAGDVPWLVLVEAQKNRRPGLRFEPDVFMEDEGGRPSAQLQKIYREGM